MHRTDGALCRSLVAAYALVHEGVGNVAIMNGGFSAWISSGRCARTCTVDSTTAARAVVQGRTEAPSDDACFWVNLTALFMPACRDYEVLEEAMDEEVAAS